MNGWTVGVQNPLNAGIYREGNTTPTGYYALIDVTIMSANSTGAYFPLGQFTSDGDMWSTNKVGLHMRPWSTSISIFGPGDVWTETPAEVGVRRQLEAYWSPSTGQLIRDLDSGWNNSSTSGTRTAEIPIFSVGVLRDSSGNTWPAEDSCIIHKGVIYNYLPDETTRENLVTWFNNQT